MKKLFDLTSTVSRRMLRVFAVTFAATFALSVGAAPVDEATALRVARNYVSQHIAVNGDWNSAKTPEVTGVALITHGGAPIGYLATVAPSGFLLVSYDDDLTPVIVFSPVGKFDTANLTTNGSLESWIMPETKMRLEAVSERRQEMLQVGTEESLLRLKDESQAWRAWVFFNRDPASFEPLRLGVNEKVASLNNATVRVEKLAAVLGTSWNQGEDRLPYTYNLYTPPGNGCDHTVTGCVATAAAQVMKYWNWPTRGNGSSSYVNNGITLSANYDFAYNWSAMPNSLSASSGSTAIDAVARLMQHVGIAFKMNYGCSAAGGSSAYLEDAATVFPQYFGYKTGIRTLIRSSMTADSFFAGIKAELDATPPRPALFSMRTSDGGHAVVADGYQAGVASVVHINMGWGGYASAFYDISRDWTAGGSTWSATSQRAMVGIQPNSSTSCSYQLSASSLTVGTSGGSSSIGVTAGSGCTWNVINTNSWITASPTSGTGPGSVFVNVAANPSSGSRSGSLTIGGQIYAITQLGGSCSYSLSSSSQTFAAGANSASFTISTASSCAWSVAPDAAWAGSDPWISFLSPTSGVGTASISYSVNANTSAGSRVANLSVAGQPHTVTQTGSCTYAIYPANQSIGAGAVSNSFRLETGSNCNWSASSSASWLTASPPASGTGSTTISYAAAANSTGAERTATITVGRQIFTVTQSAANVVSAGISNGDFEQGRTVWSEQGSQLIYNDPARAHGNYWFAWLGGYDNGRDVMSQSFTVPQSTGTVGVKFWYNITTSETVATPYDSLTVEVYSIAGARLATLGGLSNVNKTSGWVQSQSFDISAFKGQSITLVFTATTDVSNTTSFYIDDVQLATGTSGCPYTVSPLTQSILSVNSAMTFNVVTGSTCTWSSSAVSPWLSIASGGAGQGNAVVKVTASENSTGAPRTGTVVIAGQTVTINQAGPTAETSLVKNGEFEQGTDYWQEGSTGGYGIITADPSITARTGVGYAWLGGYAAGTDTLVQPISIPAGNGGATFSYWYRVTSSDLSANSLDSMTVTIVDAANGQTLVSAGRLTNLDRTATWTKSADFDVSAIRGKNVQLVFRANNDAQNITSFYIDSAKISTLGTDPSTVNDTLLQRGGIDINGDGQGEIVVRSTFGDMLQGKLSGNQILWYAVADPGPDFKVMGSLDIGNKGKSDLVVLNIAQGDSGEARFWREYNPNLDKLLRSVRTLWRVDAVGDLDGDGYGDLVWRFTGSTANANDTGVSYIWFTDGNGVTQVRKRGGAPLNWTLLGAKDINGDSAADMVYVSPDNQIRVLMATPNRTCANLSGGAIPAGFTALRLASFTGIGKGDILVRNAQTGQVQLINLTATGLPLPAYSGAPDDPNASCTSSGTVVPSSVYPISVATDPSWQFLSAADLNGDGIADIVWRRPDGGLVLWLMGAGGRVATTNTNAGTLTLNYQSIQR